MAGPSLLGIVNPDLLKWARVACALEVDVAAKKIGVKPDRLEAWERGELAPTISQLRTLADVYKRSVSFFFLNERPAAAKKPVDFRRFELSAAQHTTPELENAIRAAQAKREAVLDILAEADEEPPKFNLWFDANLDPERAAAHLVQQLGITMQDRDDWSDQYAALRAWKMAAEAHGVLVMQVSRISLDEMRGCSLAMFPMPVVLLNGSDSVLGRVFTLLHELTHLARHESGLCDVVEEGDRPKNAQQVEVFCNHVAGAALVPKDALLHHPLVLGANRRSEWDDEQLVTLRSEFWASHEVILRRLLIAGVTSQAFYQRKRDEFLKKYKQLREKDESGGFVPFPRKVVLGNGRLLTSLVLDAYESRAITGSELSRVLGTKLDHLPAIISEVRGRNAA
ncbi:MAG TPA: XRE family transcriptional regulator [Steroidobacteraceae bacterium]|jgi:Zn-dependent peptidase ImmA (M78 family)/DNA-binding XRE family transcriptional regulator